MQASVSSPIPVISTSIRRSVISSSMPVAVPAHDAHTVRSRATSARSDHRRSDNLRYDDIITQIAVQPRSPGSRIAKRTIDLVLSAVGLVVLLPFLLLIGLAVKLTSPGPILFVQDRSGLGGRTFRFYKFRTMVQDAERRKRELEHLNEMTGPIFKIRRDPRITPLGGVLRKLSLDELPQLWNVLRGDMSLVGPRPPLPSEVIRYTPRQLQRLSVSPGITGLWQVSGRSDIDDFERWIDLDLQYARTWSLWLDLRILSKTLIVVARGRGAH